MRLRELSIVNFRNYEETTLECGEFNVFVGLNAQGKTNLLEAMLYLATTKSHRTTSDDELVRAGAEIAYLSGTIEDSIACRRIEITNPRGKKKQVKLDGKRLHRFSALIGLLKVVFFAPESTMLVKGGPGDRRRFLDLLVSQVRREYLDALQRYQTALRQRNETLKQIRDGVASRRMLNVWDGPLIEAGGRLIRFRRDACDLLRPMLQRQHAYLTEGGEHADCHYAPNVPIHGDGDRIEDDFADQLAAASERDVWRGTTSTGPHRDDLLLTVNGTDARRFASQGQQRTLTLALKLAELEWIRVVAEELPILLLDDVTSELDAMRTRLLFEALHELPPQVFLTTTRLDGSLYGGSPTDVWEIRAGTAKHAKSGVP